MRKLLLIFFLVFGFVCLGQTSTTDFSLSLDFAPSFTYPSNLIIRSAQGVNSIELSVYRNGDKNNVVLYQQTMVLKSGIDTLTSFLKTYQFQIKGSTDTIGEGKAIIMDDTLTYHTISVGLME